ncbi:HNH endonuclease [Kineosporia corallincola]|uniref:HNH endonuclease n=1 Tax=Kineosporia corallincola TaxID=2835133 RepID=UPI003555F29F
MDWRIRGDRYEEATVDHIVPITAGGEHALANAQLAHWTCNAAKRNSTDVVAMSVPERGRKRVIARWPVEAQPPSLPLVGSEPMAGPLQNA